MKPSNLFAAALASVALALSFHAAAQLPPQKKPQTIQTPAPPQEMRWVPARNGQVPPGAVIGGQEPGRSLPICRAKLGKGVHPGKVVEQNCNFGFNGREITVPVYEVLVGDAKSVRWVAGIGGSAPADAYAGGEEPGRKLFICRAPYRNGVHPGKLVGKNCMIGWGGREIPGPKYEVLTVAPRK